MSSSGAGHETDQPAAPPWVLVIDDDVMIGALIARTLTGYRVTTVTQAPQALARLDEGARPDLILCDLMMPGMSGWDLDRHLTERHPELRARMFYMTGGGFNPEAEAFLSDLPADRVLRKPFTPEVLRQRVAAAVQSSTP